MVTLRKEKVLIYVDRSSQQWIVRDPEGHYWFVLVQNEESLKMAKDDKPPKRRSSLQIPERQ